MSDADSPVERDEAWLRVLLVRSLRQQGLRRACKGEPATYDDFSNRASQVVMFALVLGVVFCFSDWLDASDAGSLGLAVLVIFILGLTAVRRGTNVAATFLLLCWLMCTAVQVAANDHDVWATVGVPFLVTFVGVAVIRTRRLAVLARSAPLVLPVTLSVLVIPLFTDDLWSAVHRLNFGNLLAVAALSLLPLLIAVERRLSAEVERAARAAAQDVDPATALADLRSTLMALLSESERPGAEAELEKLLAIYGEPFVTDDATLALIEPLRRRLGLAVGWVVAGLAAVATFYMGLMCWALIPIANARVWTEANVPVQPVAVLGLSCDVPVGPYPMVALLLGILASAVLLASVVVDEDYARRMADALLQRPAAEAIATLVPYLRIRDADESIPSQLDEQLASASVEN